MYNFGYSVQSIVVLGYDDGIIRFFDTETLAIFHEIEAWASVQQITYQQNDDGVYLHLKA